MTSHIFGVGLGLFIILTFWILASLIFLVSLRIEKRIGAVAFAVAAIVTVILISVPRASQHPVVQENKPYDHFFIWRLILLILLAATSLIGVIGYIKFGLMDVARSQRISNWPIKMLSSVRHILRLTSRGISLLSHKNKKFEIKDNTEFVDKVMNSRIPVIVNFHAEWCDPCKILTPKLEDLIGPMNNLNLAIVNVESNPELVHTFEVKAVPAVIAVSNGLVVDKFIGLVDANMIDNLIKKLTATSHHPPEKGDGTI